MKTKLLIPMFLLMILLGCKEETQIEIIPNYDKIYLPLNEVNETPQLLEGNEDELIKDINIALSSISDSSNRKISLDYNFMINESGSIDKVKIIKSDNEEINNLVLGAIKSWKFNPGVNDGKSVKSQYRWKFYLGDKQELKPVNEGEYLVATEIMPELIGGFHSIQEKIIYPEVAKRAGIEGKVYVLALIDEAGNVASARIIKGIGAGCDETALDAVKNVKFIPGRKNGNPVKVQVTVPIVFKLQ